MANRLREVRFHKMMSVAELARRSGISRATIHKLERGDMQHAYTTRTLAKLAHALDTPVAEIFDIEPGALEQEA